MKTGKTNIEKILHDIRENSSNHDDTLKKVLQDQFQKVDKAHQTIRKTIKSTNNSFNNLNFDRLDRNLIYHVSHIKTTAIDYRLRFLDTKHFKGEIPAEAISKIRQLENEHNIKLSGYKILAPSKMFKLIDKDDPLLFIPLGNDYYYLIHKWGTDLHPLRKQLMWPFKNAINLLLCTLCISFITTLLIPDGLFSKTTTTVQFWVLFFFTFKAIVAITIYYAFAKGKNFNNAIWESKFQ